jgi:hypothetical protein
MSKSTVRKAVAFFEPSSRYHLVQFGTQSDLTYCRIPLNTVQGVTRLGNVAPPFLMEEAPAGTTLCSICARRRAEYSELD